MDGAEESRVDGYITISQLLASVFSLWKTTRRNEINVSLDRQLYNTERWAFSGYYYYYYSPLPGEVCNK